MRYERTASFRADFNRLTAQERTSFIEAVRRFNMAADAWVRDQEPWPAALRVKAVRGAPGIWEMTWSFSGPDGRATFEWVSVSVHPAGGTLQAPAVRWRRIGSHRVLTEP